jgi:hypothetical protein
MLDIYMSDAYKQDWEKIVELAKLDDKESRMKLRKYAMEGCRLATNSFGLFREAAQEISIEEGGKTYNLKPGDQIFVNLVCYPRRR